MLRFILYTLSFLLALRFVSVIARVIAAGKRRGPRIGEEPPDRGEATQDPGHPPRPRVRRSDAVDVPFTDIPPDSPP